MKNTIIFDLWNTLAKKKSVSTELCNYFGLKRTDDFLSEYECVVQTKKWNSLEDLAVHFLDSFDLPVSDSNKDYVTKTFREGIENAYPLEGVKELLSKLKHNYKLGLLSNTSVFEVLKDDWDMHKFFDTILYSWKTGVLKPSMKSFVMAHGELGTQPNECIFVDDLLRNVVEAKSYGMKTVLFKSVRQLEEELYS